MEPIYRQEFSVTDAFVDRYGRLKPSTILFLTQEASGRHCDLMSLGYDTMASRRLFWAVTRHRVQISRLPQRGETVRIETWPLPTTRVAYPRSVVAYDAQGAEVFRAISIWVLMNLDTRAMVLPGKSGIIVPGTVRGTELAVPGALIPLGMGTTRERTVCFTDLDRNGHMNNTRYLDWIDDLLPSAFHETHPLRELTICYHTESREGETLRLQWALGGGALQVDAMRGEANGAECRVFSAKLLY